MVIAVFDPVQSALTGALSVLQVPAADLRECVLGIGELYLLSAGEGAVAVAVGDHQCAAALDELDELGIVDLRADNDNADTVVLLGVGLAAFYLLKRLAQVREVKADGAIYEQMKFCTYWSYELVIANTIMPRDYGIQILSIDRPYIVGQSGQLRTRVQAFVESIEMKKLRAAQKEEN